MVSLNQTNGSRIFRPTFCFNTFFATNGQQIISTANIIYVSVPNGKRMWPNSREWRSSGRPVKRFVNTRVLWTWDVLILGIYYGMQQIKNQYLLMNLLNRAQISMWMQHSFLILKSVIASEIDYVYDWYGLRSCSSQYHCLKVPGKQNELFLII